MCYVASMMIDKMKWIGTYNAAPAYKLLGENVAFGSSDQPPLDTP